MEQTVWLRAILPQGNKFEISEIRFIAKFIEILRSRIETRWENSQQNFLIFWVLIRTNIGILNSKEIHFFALKLTCIVSNFPAFVRYDLYVHKTQLWDAFFRRDLSGRKWYLSISFVVSNSKLIPLHKVSFHQNLKDRNEITLVSLITWNQLYRMTTFLSCYSFGWSALLFIETVKMIR